MKKYPGIFLIVLVSLIFENYLSAKDALNEERYIKGFFTIMSISRKKDVYEVYALKDGIKYKIASAKSFIPDSSEKIHVGKSYYLILESILFEISPLWRTEMTAIEVTPTNLIELDTETHQLYNALNLRGLYFFSHEKVLFNTNEKNIPVYIDGIFNISRITKQRNVYIIYACKDKVLYKIVSPKSFKVADAHKVKENSSYYLVIFSLVNDQNSHQSEIEIVPGNFIKVEKNSQKLYETISLTGLYYTPDD